MVSCSNTVDDNTIDECNMKQECVDDADETVIKQECIEDDIVSDDPLQQVYIFFKQQDIYFYFLCKFRVNDTLPYFFCIIQFPLVW